MIPLEFLSAFKAGHNPATREFIDEELSWRLLDKVLNDGCEESRRALRFLSKFNNEFHQNFIKKDDPNSIHNTDELRKSCYSMENSRNRDISSMHQKVESITNMYHAKIEEKPLRQVNHEDNLIKIIDFLKEFRKAPKN